MQATKINPTESLDRIPSLDFLRGIAILGIIFINIESFVYPDAFTPWKNGFQSEIDYSTRFWVYFLTQGKFYTMFALLFGVGFVIFLNRLESRNVGLKAMDIYTRRLLWLFIFGVIHAYFIWTGDVLYHYAICGLFLLPFRSIQSKYLVFVILLLAVFPMVKSYESTTKRQESERDYLTAIKVTESERTEEDKKKIASWERLTEKKSPDTSYIKPKKETYWSGVKESYQQVKVHDGVFYYQHVIFSSLMIMLTGMILYRTGIFSNYRVWKYYWLISITLLIIGLLVNYFRVYKWTYEYYKPITNVWEGYLSVFNKELLGVAYILIINGLYQKFLVHSKIKLISNVGKTALSNYLFQSITLGIVFYGYGFQLFNRFSRFELLGIILCVWIVQVTLTALWLKKHQYGPMEWLWRKLTYSSFIKKDN